MSAGKKFVVRTFGCQMNEHDSERIASILSGEGMERTDDVAEADVVVFNTCCIRQNADDKLYGNLGRLRSMLSLRPEVQVAVGGCLAQKDREELLRRAPFVDVVFGTHNVRRVADLLAESRASGEAVLEILEGPAPEGSDLPGAMAVRRDLPFAAWVTIQAGCDNSCAFCIVPSVRGEEVSKPFGDIVREVEDLASSGTVEVTLLGQNVNSYGRDITTRLRGLAAGTASHPHEVVDLGSHSHEAGDAWLREGGRRPRPLFADLLRAIGAVPGIRRVRFTSPHPKDLRPETIEAMAGTAAVCEQLHLPLQSGSDRVLRTMRRGYTAERYLERLAAARASVEDLAVTTDIIVGFPGETEEDFRATLEVVAEASYDSAYTFIFSPREGTRAAVMTDEFVPDEVVAERFERLRVVVERSALARHEARIGRVEEVLVEGVSKKRAEMLTGRTRQGKLVHFAPAADEGRLGSGSFARVEIVSAAPHHLVGRLVAVEAAAAPRRRSLIPLSVD